MRVMLRQSRHSRSFSHFSTASPGAYRMDSCRDTSCSVRTVPAKHTHTHTHTHRDTIIKYFLGQRAKQMFTVSLSQRAHINMARELKLSGFELVWG